MSLQEENAEITSQPQPQTIQSKLQELQSKYENGIHLHILVPCYGALVTCQFTGSLLKLIQLFQQINMKMSVQFCPGDSLVSRARNNLIAKAMVDPTMTHCMFIDADIQFDPHSILKLLLHDRPINGALYPKKSYKWSNLFQEDYIKKLLDTKNQREDTKAMTNEMYLQHNLVHYNCNFTNDSRSVSNNLIKLKHIATGFMMIQRSVIEKMMSFYADLKYTDSTGFIVDDENKFCYALFDCRVKNNAYLSEDWLFCERYLDMDEKNAIFADITIPLNHVGTVQFNGNFCSTILTTAKTSIPSTTAPQHSDLKTSSTNIKEKKEDIEK